MPFSFAALNGHKLDAALSQRQVLIVLAGVIVQMNVRQLGVSQERFKSTLGLRVAYIPHETHFMQLQFRLMEETGILQQMR